MKGLILLVIILIVIVIVASSRKKTAKSVTFGEDTVYEIKNCPPSHPYMFMNQGKRFCCKRHPVECSAPCENYTRDVYDKNFNFNCPSCRACADDIVALDSDDSQNQPMAYGLQYYG